MKGYILLLLCLLGSWTVGAQSMVSFAGQVIDEQQKGIGYATILLSDSGQQFGTVADSCGRFSLAVVPGKYQVRAQCVGFDELTAVREIREPVFDTLRLQSSEKQLSEVVISANRIQRKADRFVLQVPPALSQDGIELLRQAPGVWFSDGKIAINGSFGTKAYVDDREIRLEGELLTAYLQSLRAEDIRSIEVVPFAGAEQDAQSKGGAIHIRMRRSADRGMQGNVSLQASAAKGFQQYQPHISLNSHWKKWNWYATTSLTYTPRSDGSLSGTRTYQTTDKRFHNEDLFKTPAHYEAIRSGLLFELDSVHLLGIEGEYLHRYADRSSENRTTLGSSCYTLYNIGNYRQQEMYRMASANFHYRYTKGGSSFKLLGEYIYKRSEGDNRYSSQQESAAFRSDTLYRMNSLADYRIANLDIGWSHTADKTSALSLGTKYTFNGMEDDACSEGWQEVAGWERIPAYDYALDYHEHIAAMYATYSKKWQRWSLKAGLRAEYSRTFDRTEQLRRDNFSLFPHFDLSWAMDGLQQKLWVAQYARYIERPPFAALNPNRIQHSEYSYSVGNPALRPTYINRFSLTFVLHYRYTLTIGGNLHRDLIRQFTRQDEANPDISYVTFANHHRENHWFIATTLPLQPVYWFGMNLNLVGAKQDIQLEKSRSYATHYLYFGNATATFYLPRDIQIEAQYSGASRLYSGNSEVAPAHWLSLHLRKKWHDGRWSLRLSLNNLTNQQAGYVGRVADYTHYTDLHLPAAGRNLQIGITWNFSTGKTRKLPKVEKNSTRERARLKENI